MEWISTKEKLPDLERMYWITDGKDIALAKFNVESMMWCFLWHYSVFKPTFMCEIKLQQIPKEQK